MIISPKRREHGTAPAPDLGSTTVRLAGVDVVAPDRAVLAPAGLDLDVAPGVVTALAGPNGAGKSTAVLVLLGVLTPDAGRVVLQPADGPAIDLDEIDPRTYWSQIAWVPQRPVIEPGTLRDAVLQGRDIGQGELERAAALTGLDAVVAERAEGWDALLGQGGAGLSLGQRQRLALTRALLAPAPLVVLDEPSAHLDADGEAVVLAVVDRLRASGRSVLLVAHRDSLLRLADTVVEVSSAARTQAPA